MSERQASCSAHFESENSLEKLFFEHSLLPGLAGEIVTVWVSVGISPEDIPPKLPCPKDCASRQRVRTYRCEVDGRDMLMFLEATGQYACSASAVYRARKFHKSLTPPVYGAMYDRLMK